jgi:hypothetical protein
MISRRKLLGAAASEALGLIFLANGRSKNREATSLIQSIPEERNKTAIKTDSPIREDYEIKKIEIDLRRQAKSSRRKALASYFLGGVSSAFSTTYLGIKAFRAIFPSSNKSDIEPSIPESTSSSRVESPPQDPMS